LLSGRYPTGPNEIALTPGLASGLNLHVGDVWPQGGKTVVGMVQNPQSLLDEFALVAPGQLTNPTQVNVLFNAPGVDPSRIGQNVYTPAHNGNSNPVNPDTIVLAVATVGMLLIALVAIGGFTVLAQRRLRALGMLESMGATDRNVRLVIRANGLIVGVVGAVMGFVLGLAVWLAYRPHNEQDAHHLIPMFALPWVVILPLDMESTDSPVRGSSPAPGFTDHGFAIRVLDLAIMCHSILMAAISPRATMESFTCLRLSTMTTMTSSHILSSRQRHRSIQRLIAKTAG